MSLIRLMLLLSAPAVVSTACVDEGCLAKDSVLLQVGNTKLAKADLTQEELARLEHGQLARSQQETTHDHPGEDYIICLATGKEGQAGKLHHHKCQEKCVEEDPASCEEGGENHGACNCLNLTDAAAGACEGKQSGEACNFRTESLQTEKGPTNYWFRSMCHYHEGALSCMPMRRLDCHTGFGKTLQWMPVGSPCINRMATEHGPVYSKTEEPQLSYCEYKDNTLTELRCAGGYNPSGPIPEVSAMIKAEFDKFAKVLKFWNSPNLAPKGGNGRRGKGGKRSGKGGR